MKALLKKLMSAFTGTKPSVRDLTYLQHDEFRVKQKLGQAFFRRKMNSNTRRARIRTLTQDEKRIAIHHGWIDPRYLKPEELNG